MNTHCLSALGVICALGAGKVAIAHALFAGDTRHLVPVPGWVPGAAPPLGAVATPLPGLPAGLAAEHDNRCNRLLHAAIQEIEGPIRAAITRRGGARIGVVIGTSTSGIEEATAANQHYRQSGAWPASYRYGNQELVDPARFLADWLDLAGPCVVISTACTAGARALISARRLLDADMCDAVICGGVDALARLPLNGFRALGAMDDAPCRPFAADRHGISIGEAAAVFLMTRDASGIQLLGAGASSDAWHMSSPDPEGLGAQRAMQAALADAALPATAIDYVNLHGTATPHNDAMEAHAMEAVFPQGVACSSTKPLTGHTLAAAGALEAAICWLALGDGRLPPQVAAGPLDAALPTLHFTTGGDRLAAGKPHRLMSNSFAFGGNNASLILGEAT